MEATQTMKSMNALVDKSMKKKFLSFGKYSLLTIKLDTEFLLRSPFKKFHISKKLSNSVVKIMKLLSGKVTKVIDC